jgi:hypothetical protein
MATITLFINFGDSGRGFSFMDALLYRNIGEVHKVPHSVNGKKISHLIKKGWLDKNGTSPIYHICGELSSLYTVLEAIKKGRKIKLLIGNELINSANRDELANLLEMKSEFLTVFSLAKRPEMHGTLIDNNLFIEDWHDFGNEYPFATVIENAKPTIINTYMNYFYKCENNLQPLTPQEVRDIPIRNN